MGSMALTVPWSVTVRMEASVTGSAAVFAHLVGMGSIVRSQVKAPWNTLFGSTESSKSWVNTREMTNRSAYQ